MSNSIAQVPKLSLAAVKQRKREEERAYFAAQKGVTRCTCGWSYKGRFGDGTKAFLHHRERRCRLRKTA